MTFPLSKSFATNQLDLGSDHRTVYTGVDFSSKNQTSITNKQGKTHEYGNHNAFVCIKRQYRRNSIMMSFHLFKDWKGLC